MIDADDVANAVAQHYEEFLAEHYTWMFGVQFEAKVAEQRSLLASLGVAGGRHATAVDLGSGPGFQALALAELGFSRVVAIDTSQALLAELESKKGDFPVQTVRADLLEFAELFPRGSVELIVCMGDTLTHLATPADVSQLFADARATLVPEGLFVLTFRDLSAELTGLDRFIPVRADPDQIMTCVLEYEAETVLVNDLIYVRDGTGWSLRKSSYRKLRLAPEAIADELVTLGFNLQRNETAGGLCVIAASK